MLSSKKEAFKMGFVSKLAEHGVSLVELAEKSALFSPVSGLLGAGLTAGVAIPALAISGAGLGLTGSTKVPYEGGRGLGYLAHGLSESGGATPKMLRKEYLLYRYKQLLDRKRAERDLKLVTQAKRDVLTGVDDEEEEGV